VDGSQEHLNASQTARRLGLTVRALRVYEREGLLQPRRTAAGWRVYGPDAIARLHQILALKRMGLSLRRIGELLRGGAVDLDRLLALQEAALADQKGRVDRALDLVRAARARLARGEALPTDDLVNLVRETNMSDFKWTAEHDALAAKHFTPEQLEALKRRKLEDYDQEKISAAWADLIAEATRLQAIGDPGSPEALDLARRWNAQVAEFTQGDEGLARAAGGMYRDAFADPGVAPTMPFSAELWGFVAEASRRLKSQEA
jgi:DNA-binding transcriptional MerR regulator